MKENILQLIQQGSLHFDKLQKISNIDPQTLESIISELLEEELIFLNTEKKYEYIKDGYLIGTLDKTSKGSCYVIADGRKIYIKSNSLHTALKHDVVVVEEKYSEHGEIKGILKRKNNRLVCEVKEQNNRLVLVPFNGNCEIHLITDKELLKDYIIGDRVYITLSNESNTDNDIVVTNITKIGHFNDECNDEIAIAISKDFDIDFSEEAMREAEAIPQTVLEEEKIGRIDLTEETIFTIDSIHTKDMDDAISIKVLDNGNYELGVHIADVAHYIKPHSHLFKDALRRGTSVYLGEVVIPMIPSILSNGICSLNEGVERLTKSCFMEITPKGKVVGYRLQDSVIKSKKKMTYEELNEMFAGGPIDDSYLPFVEDLTHMRHLSNILTKVKNHIDFESSDIHIKKDIYDKDRILSFENRQQDEAEKLIENFMVLANENVASDFYWRDLPFIYRTHDTPEEMRLEDTIELIKELGLGKKLVKLHNAYGPKALQSILDQYKETPLYSVVSNLLLRSMAKAKYTTENIGHFALALNSYCHFTSPIRRFPDLMVHTLVNLFNGKNSRYDRLEKIQDELVYVAEHSSYKERQADDAEKDYIKLKMAIFMEEHKDEEFTGMILDMDKDRVYIKLDNNVKCYLDNYGDFAMSFDIDPVKKVLMCKYSKQKISLGTRIAVKVTRVDIPQKEVHVDITKIVKENSKAAQKKIEMK